MTLQEWLRRAKEDAHRRNLRGLEPLLEALAAATARLRQAPWNERADGPETPTAGAGGTGEQTPDG